MPCTSKSQRPTRNWLDLPSDVTSNIISRVSVNDILVNVQKVCTAWYEVCKDPATWRVIYVDYTNLYFEGETLYKQVIDRSQGQLIDITIENFCNDQSLQYVANRSSQLKRLKIASGYDFTFTDGTCIEALKKFPQLEELSLYSTKLSKEVIKTVSHYCPMLKTLKLSNGRCPFFKVSLAARNNIAIAIGENLPNLEHLELIGNGMSNIGLKSILNGCRHLKSLDLRGCFNLDLKGVFGKRCSKQIKCLKLPKDSLDGFPYIHVTNSKGYLDELSDDDYFSDDDGYGGGPFDRDAEYDNFTEYDDEYDEFDGYYNELLNSMQGDV